ncbi:hypothetical protein [Actinophytocola sediminis]
MSDHIPANLNALIQLAKGTKFESVAGDEQKLEELLLKEMQASDDPMTREIGSGIADGTMSWRTVGSTGAYSDYLQRGVQAMRDFDFGATFDALAAERAANERAAEKARPQDEDEPFTRSVLKNRGGGRPR